MHPEITELAARTEARHTICGDGRVVWRLWGDGPSVVLLHGGSGSWMHWLRAIPALEHRWRVVVPDLPGLGESAMPPGGETHPDAVAAALRAGLDAVLGAGTPFHLCGFSFGANVAGHLGAAEGARVRSLTLVGAASLGLPRPPLDLLKVRDRQGDERREANRENLARLMIHDRARIDEAALDIQDHNTRHARLRSRGYAGGDSLRRALERVRAPLAGIWGGRDAVAWPEVEARLAVLRALDPGLLAAVIPGAGHWVMHEAPAAFNAALGVALEAALGAAPEAATPARLGDPAAPGAPPPAARS